MALLKTIIDGRQVEVERDRWALEVAREMGISIPTLCHHPALEPYGACRLCVVEVTKGKATWLATSCDLPLREGLSIRTNTPAVQASRKMTLALLWARAPQSRRLAELAGQWGVEQPRFPVRDDLGQCILCGLCVRTCEQLVGACALGFSGRGPARRVQVPFGNASESCIGCNACAAVCPTGHIQTVDRGNVRHLETWQTELEMIRCDGCGQPYLPARQFQLLQARLGPLPLEKVCPACQRRRTAQRWEAAHLSGGLELAAAPPHRPVARQSGKASSQSIARNRCGSEETK